MAIQAPLEVMAEEALDIEQVLGEARWWQAHPVVLYYLRRIGLYVLTVWGSFTATFFFFRLIPGDPIAGFIGNLEQQQVTNVQATSAVINHYKQVFGLEGNLFQQYLHYMYELVVQRNLGPSLISFPTNAGVLIMQSLPWTIALLTTAVIIAWILGVLLGAVVGWTRKSPVSAGITNVSLALSHVPYYFLALILVFILAYSLNVLPSGNAYNPALSISLTPQFLFSVVRHAFLPAISIIIISVCGWIISTRMLMITILGEDYLRFARAKGLKPARIMRSYALRNVYLPQVTALGISLGFVFNGNVLVEQLFTYPGVGHLLVTAINELDYDTIMGITMLAIFSVLTANLILDLILPLLDPRVTYRR